ncbi:MAG TPA: glutathione S-transferase [Polyangiaceae bacterium]|nr:glutathione S-transferase [Polyangiaceae bacterium]
MPEANSLRLHRFSLSGHSHRAELMLSLLGLPAELVNVDLRNGEHKRPPFLAKNSFGQVPVLEDGALTLSDSNAILVYLAERYDQPGRYWPTDPGRRAQVQRWLSVAAGQLSAGPAAARLVRVFNAPLDHTLAVRKAHDLFTVLEKELTERPFLVGETPTLADVALYTYTAHAPEGDVSLEAYPAIRKWLTRIEALPGFVPMVRTPAKS